MENLTVLSEHLRPKYVDPEDFEPQIASKPKEGALRVESLKPSLMVPWKVRELRFFAIHTAGIKNPHQYKQQELYELCKSKLA